MTRPTIVIDFDSTLIEIESLDALAEFALRDRPDGAKIAAEITRITNLGMTGGMPIEESLSRRLALLCAGRAEIDALIPELRRRISKSFARNAKFLAAHRDQVIILSNGFWELVAPVVAELDLRLDLIFANRFIFDETGRVIGHDRTNLLAQAGGKSRVIEKLGLSGIVYMIGDGYTDYQTTDTGRVTKFFAFTENVRRENVVALADHEVESFDRFLEITELAP